MRQSFGWFISNGIQRRACSGFSRGIQRRPYSGLLSGLNNIEDVKNAEFYTSSMDIKSTAAFLNQSSYVYRQAEKDFKLSNGEYSNFESYISSLEENQMDWFEKNTFYDRESILKSVNSIIHKKGQFVCLLGGKSTGKSQLWNHFTNPKNNAKHRSVILLDMRAFGDGDILNALLTNLKNTKSEEVKQVLFDTVSIFAASYLALNVKDIMMVNVNDILNVFRSKNIDESQVIKELLGRFSILFGNLTVIIDEANLAFTEGIDRDPKRLMKAKRDMEVLTLLSKQLKQVFHLLIFIIYYCVVYSYFDDSTDQCYSLQF